MLQAVRKIVKMMGTHNMAPKEVWYRFLCIVRRTVPIPLDTIKQEPIIGYTVANDLIDNIFWKHVAGTRVR